MNDSFTAGCMPAKIDTILIFRKVIATVCEIVNLMISIRLLVIIYNKLGHSIISLAIISVRMPLEIDSK